MIIISLVLFLTQNKVNGFISAVLLHSQFYLLLHKIDIKI